MELQFDKEMDAILRKAQAHRGVLVGDSPPEPKKHLDADTISAFVENALPPKSKALYLEHFADCDGCRRMLSQSILLNSDAAAVDQEAVPAHVPDPAIPWYVKLFRTSNLAIAMGALVLTFGGILGYLALQNRGDGNTASVAKVTDQEPAHAPYSTSEPAANMPVSSAANATAANSMANLSVAAANSSSISNPTPSASGPSAVDEPALAGREAPGASGGATAESPSKAASVSPDDAKPVTAPPPPPVAAKPFADKEKKAGDDSVKDEDSRGRVRSKTDAPDVESRDAPSAKKSGPNRASGPRNTQQNVQQQELNNVASAGMVAPTRSAGGKTFAHRDGAWYDSAYHGQATSNYNRGTDEYKKLDGGLRKVSDSIGGTVVIVWKSKAYRIR